LKRRQSRKPSYFSPPENDRRKRSTQKDPGEKQAQAITQKQKETADFEEKKKQSSSMLINHSDPN